MPAELAPCIAVIGPADSGKTSLLHLLDERLQNHEDTPLAYMVKGNPDGGGHYSFYNPGLRNSRKGKWTTTTLDRVIDWVQNAREHLEVVLVDFGGNREDKAQEGNRRLFGACTHYLVLAKQFDDAADEREKGMGAWINDAVDSGLLPLAKVQSLIKRGNPFFDADTRTGLFRGDAANRYDTLNQPVRDGLIESLMNLRVRRGPPGYFDLGLRRNRWSENDLPGLDDRRANLRAVVRDSGNVLLGGAAPIFAYAAAFHHALDERFDAAVRIFDPKVQGGEVLIPRPGLPGPKQFPPNVLRFDWVESGVLTLNFDILTDDKFLGPDVLDGLAGLGVPRPPKSMARVEVQINGSGPIWLHLTLSVWLRSQGAGRISHWDAGFGRGISVWPLGGA